MAGGAPARPSGPRVNARWLQVAWPPRVAATVGGALGLATGSLIVLALVVGLLAQLEARFLTAGAAFGAAFAGTLMPDGRRFAACFFSFGAGYVLLLPTLLGLAYADIAVVDVLVYQVGLLSHVALWGIAGGLLFAAKSWMLRKMAKGESVSLPHS